MTDTQVEPPREGHHQPSEPTVALPLQSTEPGTHEITLPNTPTAGAAGNISVGAQEADPPVEAVPPTIAAERQRRRPPRVVLVAAGSALVLALAGLTAYLWVVADHANSRSAAYQQTLAGTRGDLTAREAALASSQSQLADTKNQLDQAQGQLRDLANQKAQSDDRIADEAKVAALLTVANDATTKCGNKIVEITNLPPTATRATVQAMSADINTLCSAANKANDALATYFKEQSNG